VVVRVLQRAEVEALSELSPAEHLEAAMRLLGWDKGPCTFEVVATDGVVKKIYPRPVALGRAELHDRPGLSRSDAA
jgi:hypothetical protein